VSGNAEQILMAGIRVVKEYADEIAERVSRLEVMDRSRRALIQIGPDAHIAHDMVASLEWRRPTYANAAGASVLIITLKDGRVFKVEHRPNNSLFPQDAYAIERELLDE